MNKPVETRDFVVAYATAWTMADVVKATGMTKAAIAARRSYLAQRGVNLPKLSIKKPLDDLEIAQLNSLIKKHDIRRQQKQLQSA